MIQHSSLSLRRGFTLVEIMIVVAIIAILAMLAVPALQRARTNAQRTRLTVQLKANADAFGMYAADNSKLPLQTASAGMTISTANVVPTGMSLYLPKNSTWTRGSDGTWYWVYWPNNLPGYKGYVFLYNPTIDTSDITYYDQQLDNGNINTGGLVYNTGNGIFYGVQ